MYALSLFFMDDIWEEDAGMYEMKLKNKDE